MRHCVYQLPWRPRFSDASESYVLRTYQSSFCYFDESSCTVKLNFAASVLIMPNIIRGKCVIVGEATVGKTALVQMILTDGRNFPKNYNLTCGVELGIKTISIPDSEDVVELFLFDSSGRDLYKEYLPKYWDGPEMLLAVYDVTSQSSMDAINEWISLVQSCMLTHEELNTPCVLFGNKTDLKERRVVNSKIGMTNAENLGLHYFEGSAKENVGIEEPFYLLAHEWHKLNTENGAG